jgi:RimJ/RimL family protein N-acetyltransferase
VLETERLILRRPVLEDATPLLEAFEDPEVMRYIGSGQTGGYDDAVVQIERMRRAWEVDGFGRLIVERKDDRSVIGRCGVLAWDPGDWSNGTRAAIGEEAELELGWTLVRRAWGSGYATEAAQAVAEWAFDTLSPRRLISLIHPDNERSKRVAAKLGQHCAESVVTHRGVTVELWTF